MLSKVEGRLASVLDLTPNYGSSDGGHQGSTLSPPTNPDAMFNAMIRGALHGIDPNVVYEERTRGRR